LTIHWNASACGDPAVSMSREFDTEFSTTRKSVDRTDCGMLQTPVGAGEGAAVTGTVPAIGGVGAPVTDGSPGSVTAGVGGSLSTGASVGGGRGIDRDGIPVGADVSGITVVCIFVGADVGYLVGSGVRGVLVLGLGVGCAVGKTAIVGTAVGCAVYVAGGIDGGAVGGGGSGVGVVAGTVEGDGVITMLYSSSRNNLRRKRSSSSWTDEPKISIVRLGFRSAALFVPPAPRDTISLTFFTDLSRAIPPPESGRPSHNARAESTQPTTKSLNSPDLNPFIVS